jgi:hypothetical protein
LAVSVKRRTKSDGDVTLVSNANLASPCADGCARLSPGNRRHRIKRLKGREVTGYEREVKVHEVEKRKEVAEFGLGSTKSNRDGGGRRSD